MHIMLSPPVTPRTPYLQEKTKQKHAQNNINKQQQQKHIHTHTYKYVKDTISIINCRNKTIKNTGLFTRKLEVLRALLIVDCDDACLC
jgi:hypothetical protein